MFSCLGVTRAQRKIKDTVDISDWVFFSQRITFVDLGTSDRRGGGNENGGKDKDREKDISGEEKE